jgi:nucleoside-diphosphate-sugar epimerase
MRRVLVTGGGGFIGSHLVEALVQRGDAVRVLDNFSTGRRENLAHLGEKIEIQEGDLRNREQVEAAVQGVEVIFHEAAFISVPQSLQEPQTCFAVNVDGTARLLEAARRAGVRKVVLASSTAVYGDTDSFPLREDTPPKPLSPYALSKQVNELYGSLYSRLFDLPVVALRYFNVYGPRQRPDSPYAAAIPVFLRRLLNGEALTIFGDGRQTRDFIFVDDVVHANLLAADSDAAGEVFNVCTGQETCLLDVVAALAQISGRRPEVRHEPPRSGDIYRSAGDPQKAALALGFRARVPLMEGLRRTLDWMRKTH